MVPSGLGGKSATGVGAVVNKGATKDASTRLEASAAAAVVAARLCTLTAAFPQCRASGAEAPHPARCFPVPQHFFLGSCRGTRALSCMVVLDDSFQGRPRRLSAGDGAWCSNLLALERRALRGALAWLTSMWGASGLASQLWLSKLKEELLSLGVISLVLAFIKTRLAHICVPLPHPGGPASEASVKNFERVAGRLLASLAEVVPDPTDISPPSYQPEENQLDTAAKCPEGKQLLFTKDLITAAHYMLFYLAIVQAS
ncbi:uncharacterized protein HaLaN_02670 [Haematococcus lacustris]|uniref:Uncharacterized protein n=1 Tax=Haematococcus lacustris TaxID=44745 RepID=A0A699YC93_HAELA|nr:uncharacterized protein HaLaN_02670 [Haematococcus lacustris]